MSVSMASSKGWAMISRPYLHTLVGWVLGYWAGAINTITTLSILFERSSHVSGRLNDVGMNIVLHPIDALLVFVIWIGFVFGAFVAGKLLDRIGFTLSLLITPAAIVLGAFLVWRGFYAATPDDYGLGRMIIAFVLPATMGYQNSLTSQLPRIGRTTHWTGDSTDIGTALAKGNYPLAAHNTNKIFGFWVGCATFGYLIGIHDTSPVHALILIVIGHTVTTILLHWLNLALGKS